MMSARDLNVTISPMDPVINNFLSRNNLADLKSSIGNIFSQQKANGTELVVVVIPDYPPGVYGK